MYLLSQRAKASYLSPLFYKGNDLERLRSHPSGVIPTYFDDVLIHKYRLGRQYHFLNVRLFKDSISIPPHDQIDDQETSHHYTFCKKHKIGFHSAPINLQDSQADNLLSFVSRIVGTEKGDDIEIQVSKIFDLIPEFFGLERDSKEGENIIQNSINRISNTDRIDNSDLILDKLTITDKLLILEDILFQYFGIRQLIKFERP